MFFGQCVVGERFFAGIFILVLELGQLLHDRNEIIILIDGFSLTEGVIITAHFRRSDLR